MENNFCFMIMWSLLSWIILDMGFCPNFLPGCTYYLLIGRQQRLLTAKWSVNDNEASGALMALSQLLLSKDLVWIWISDSYYDAGGCAASQQNIPISSINTQFICPSATSLSRPRIFLTNQIGFILLLIWSPFPHFLVILPSASPGLSQTWDKSSYTF